MTNVISELAQEREGEGEREREGETKSINNLVAIIGYETNTK